MPNPTPNNREANASASSPDLGLTMTQILRNPLSALRASMETLAGEFRADDPRSQKLSGALEQVLAMSHDVEALLQLTAPRPLAPLTCSVDEILHSALRRQGFENRARVRIASPVSPETLCVDGPLLADCLARMLEYVLACGADTVLLSARHDGDVTRFGVVTSGSDVSNTPLHEREIPLQRCAALELGLALARRDAVRMNATLESTTTSLGNTSLSIAIGASTETASAR
jgi:hypothetical protein